MGKKEHLSDIIRTLFAACWLLDYDSDWLTPEITPLNIPCFFFFFALLFHAKTKDLPARCLSAALFSLCLPVPVLYRMMVFSHLLVSQLTAFTAADALVHTALPLPSQMLKLSPREQRSSARA